MQTFLTKVLKKPETFPDVSAEAEDTLEELSGSLSFQLLEDKLLHAVLDADKEHVDDAKLLEQSMASSGSFHPDLVMQQLVKNYSLAKELYGETLLRLLTSYDPDYIEKNIDIPEFQRDLQQKIERKVEELKKKNLVTSESVVSKKGEQLAALVMCVEELDSLQPRGFFGGRTHKRKHMYGERGEIRNFRKGDRYHDIAMRKSVRLALRRGHTALIAEDLVSTERLRKGKVDILYAIDASGSMKGKKLQAAKKAGIALAFKAIQEKDRVGVVVFESDITASIEPTTDFPLLLHTLSSITASKQTDLPKVIEHARTLFPDEHATKHLIILTDALPTVGDNPQQETLEAVSAAREAGITTSLIGLGLEEDGVSLAKRVTEIGSGSFHQVRDLDNVDKIVLEEYYEVY